MPGTPKALSGRLEVWVYAAVEVLVDGEWHPREPLVRLMMRRVPPGKALRMAEKRRRLTNQHDKPRQKVYGEDRLIDIGARFLCTQALQGKTLFETRDLPDGTREVRLTESGLMRARNSNVKLRRISDA